MLYAGRLLDAVADRTHASDRAIDSPARRRQVGGQSFGRAIVLVSDAGWSCAHRLGDGSVSVHSGPLAGRTRSRIPFVRAQTAHRAQDVATDAALKAAGLRAPAKATQIGMGVSWRLAVVMALFAYGPAWLGLETGASWGLTRLGGVLLGVVLLSLVWSLVLATIRPVSGAFRTAHHHGAEHAVIDAWRTHGHHWKQALASSRHRLPDCGTTYVLWQVLGLFACAVAVLWWPIPAPARLLVLLVALIVWPAVVSEAMLHEPARRILGGLGLLGQRLSTSPPDPQDLELAVSAGEALFGQDPVPAVTGTPGHPQDMDRPVVPEVRQDTWTGKRRGWGKVGAFAALLSGMAAFGIFFGLMEKESLTAGESIVAYVLVPVAGIGVFVLAALWALRSGLIPPGRTPKAAASPRDASRAPREPHGATFRRLTMGLLILFYSLAGFLTFVYVSIALEPENDLGAPAEAYFAAIVISWLLTVGPLLLLAIGLHFWRRRGRRSRPRFVGAVG